MAQQLEMRIGAEWRPGEQRFDSLEPFSRTAWTSVPEGGQADVRDAIAAARRAFDQGPWPRLSPEERAAHLRRLADLLDRDAEELATMESRDNGKGMREVHGQIKSIGGWYRHFGEVATSLEGRVVNTKKPNFLGFVIDEPIGVVAAILPWNSPLFLLAFKLAPALAAGCTFVTKPSEVAPASILHFARLVEEAGIPEGVFNTVSGSRPEVGQWLVQSPDVDKVTFTGSEQVGALVAQSAAVNLTPVALELGGKSPNIVFEDANIDEAVSGLVAGIFAAGGQTCIAGSRALIHESIYDEVMDRVVERARTIRLGNPADRETDMGPLASQAQFEKVQTFADKAREAGLDIRLGGKPADVGGWFFEPTIIADVPDDHDVWVHEVFGPILACRSFADEEEAFALANCSNYGLAAGVWTSDIRRGIRATRRLRAGTVWINTYRTMGMTMPFGGVKNSGFGRENGVEGIKEFLVPKAVWVETDGVVRDPFTVG